MRDLFYFIFPFFCLIWLESNKIKQPTRSKNVIALVSSNRVRHRWITRVFSTADVLIIIIQFVKVIANLFFITIISFFLLCHGDAGQS